MAKNSHILELIKLIKQEETALRALQKEKIVEQGNRLNGQPKRNSHR